MAQHDYNIANNPGAVFRADINDVLGALATNNSGASEPSPTFSHQWWFDTTNSLIKQRNAANTDWVTIGVKDGSGFRPYHNDSELAPSASEFPTNTKLLFPQSAAPTGWTKDTDQDNKALRIVSGTGGATGGATGFTSVFGASKTAGETTLTTAQIPAHLHPAGTLAGPNHPHTYPRVSSVSGGQAVWGVRQGDSVFGQTESSSSVGGSATGSTGNNAGGGNPHSHSLELNLAYVDVIKATKD